MINWGTQYPKLYNLFHKLWTSSVGTAEYNKPDWRDFDAELDRAIQMSELSGMIKALKESKELALYHTTQYHSIIHNIEINAIQCQKELDRLLKENQSCQ